MCRFLFVSAAVVLSVAVKCEGEEPTGLAPPFALTVAGDPLDVPLLDESFPWLGDFDGDGRPDLLVGQRNLPGEQAPQGGALRLYKNIGQTHRPRFGDSLWFHDLVPTGRIPRGCERAPFNPQLGDFNGDNLTDLISGSSCCQNPNCFYVFLRRKDGKFGARRRVNLRLPGGPNGRWALGGTLKKLETKVTIADWNGDDVPDAIIGDTTQGRLGLAYGPLADKNEVTVQRLWPKGEEPFHRMTTNPCAADWDGDGLTDLVVGGYQRANKRYETQGIYWLRNVGTKQKPKLAEPKLVLADKVLLFTLGICVADFNGDGAPDLIASRKKKATPRKSSVQQHRVWVYLRQPR